MKRISRLGMAAALLVCTLSPRMAWGQVGGYGGRGRGMGGLDRYGPPAPKLPGPELDGPPDSATARELLGLTQDQAARYAQAYDSFMVATRPQRDSARLATDKMNDRLDSGDLAAAMFYAERLQDLGKYLRNRQDKFEDDLKRLVSSDQMKSYRRWKDEQDRAAEAKRREDGLRWREAAVGGERPAMAPERKTVIADAAGVAHADLGSQAVRVGRTVYVASQLAVDSAGTLVGGDLRNQAERAFANLTTVLRSAGASPQDVVAVTIYVANYRPADFATIRDAGALYFGPNPPTVTLLGVQSLGREGALVAVGATAITGASGFARGSPRERER